MTARAGCGKTTLAAHIIQKFIDQGTPSSKSASEQTLGPDGEKRYLLYFLFSRSNHGDDDPATAALRSIVKQLVDQFQSLIPVILRRYDLLSVRGHFVWTWEILWDMFEEMLGQLPQSSETCLTIDAIDECDKDSRELMLDALTTLVEGLKATTSPPTILKVLLTSRPDQCVHNLLSMFPCLEIQNAHTANDMNALILQRTQTFAIRRHLDSDVKERTTQFLQENAQGMFLWVVLVMDELERRGERLTDEVIAAKLSQIPLTLVKTYEGILNNPPTSRRSDLWRIIRWLVFGKRGLTLAELETALCLEVGIPKWHDFPGDLKFLCGSLIRIDGPRGEINLVHQTAQEFLKTYIKHASLPELGNIDLDPVVAEKNLSRICVEYLLLDDHFSELEAIMDSEYLVTNYQVMISLFLRRHPFICYVIENWASHLRAIGSQDELLSGMVLKLLSPSKHRAGIMRLTYYINHNGNPFVPMGRSSIHLAAYFDLPWLLETYIETSKGTAVHDVCETEDTPMIWASEMGSTECEKTLGGWGRA